MSGGLYPGLVPSLMKFFGEDFVIQAGGGIHRHTNGTVSGAIDMRQAVDATLQGASLQEFAKTHKESRVALDVWE